MENYRVTATVLNIRKSPSLDGEVINALHKGESVQVLDKSPDLYWFKVKKNNAEGWVSHKWLELVMPESTTNEEFPWMPIALTEIGTKETKGNSNNPRVLSYLATTTLDISAEERATDSTAWCSAFVNWCVEKSGYEGTDKAAADSWLKWGKSISTPRRGCIAVFKRPKGNHVAFYISETEDEITVLGGNQEITENGKTFDSVNIKPRSRKDLLGYRVPMNFVI